MAVQPNMKEVNYEETELLQKIEVNQITGKLQFKEGGKPDDACEFNSIIQIFNGETKIDTPDNNDALKTAVKGKPELKIKYRLNNQNDCYDNLKTYTGEELGENIEFKDEKFYFKGDTKPDDACESNENEIKIYTDDGPIDTKRLIDDKNFIDYARNYHPEVNYKVKYITQEDDDCDAFAVGGGARKMRRRTTKRKLRRKTKRGRGRGRNGRRKTKRARGRGRKRRSVRRN